MKIGKIGIISGGIYDNWKIVILDDDSTGGYYILIWSESKNQGYDDWFENAFEAEQYVRDNYIVEWSDVDYKQPKSFDEANREYFELFQKKAEKKGFYIKNNRV